MIPAYAPVGPLVSLRRLADEGLLGNYQLLIAPVILNHQMGYRNFFLHHDDQFVIVDNGVIEQGYPLDVRDLYRAARIANAHLVVMPDTIDDGKMTVKQVRAALPAFRKLDRSIDTLGVVQGRTFEECMTCARQLVEEGVDWLAVPRGLTPNLGTRTTLVKAVGDEFNLPIHILGFSNNIADDILSAVAHPLVRGIDAATPLWLTKPLPRTPPTDAEGALGLGRRPGNYWNVPATPMASVNVDTVQRWLLTASASESGTV